MPGAVHESVVGTFRTFRDVQVESGIISRADVCQRLARDGAILVRCYWIAPVPEIGLVRTGLSAMLPVVPRCIGAIDHD